MFLPSFLLENSLQFLHTEIGAIIFVPFYALWVILLLPGVWVSMVAGALYGAWLGSLLAFFGACIGAEVVFLLGRTLFRQLAKRFISNFPKIEIIEKAVSSEGLKLIFLTRLSPVFPFSLLNLVYGLSDVTLRDYTIGLIGILPGTIFYCVLGSLVVDLANLSESVLGVKDSSFSYLSFLGMLSTLGVIWIVTRSIQKALRETNLYS